MRALTLTQPWATLVAIGEKSIDTRSWGTKLSGERIAIHAAKGFPLEARAICRTEPFRSVLSNAGIHHVGTLPTGAIVAVADIAACMRFTEHSLGWVRTQSARSRYPAHEAAFGDFTAGRFGFFLRAVLALPTSVPARGMLSLWQVPDDVERAVLDQLQGVPA